MKKSTKPVKLAILASGGGTNAGNFMAYFKNHPGINVALIISNNPSAYVLERAAAAGIPARVIRGSQWEDHAHVKGVFREFDIDALVLAGYMKLVPSWVIKMFAGKVFNIHPALLPAYGGKGMYGMHVHRAVLEAGASHSGITIHLVNEEYDKGPILFQKKIEIADNETPESLAAKIHELEYQYYPRIVESTLTARSKATCQQRGTKCRA